MTCLLIIAERRRWRNDHRVHSEARRSPAGGLEGLAQRTERPAMPDSQGFGFAYHPDARGCALPPHRTFSSPSSIPKRTTVAKIVGSST